ncbi:hypothetical protein BaRGS_00016436, partial [Batillaria attramentaria]
MIDSRKLPGSVLLSRMRPSSGRGSKQKLIGRQSNDNGKGDHSSRHHDRERASRDLSAITSEG